MEMKLYGCYIGEHSLLKVKILSILVGGLELTIAQIAHMIGEDNRAVRRALEDVDCIEHTADIRDRLYYSTHKAASKESLKRKLPAVFIDTSKTYTRSQIEGAAHKDFTYIKTVSGRDMVRESYSEAGCLSAKDFNELCKTVR